MKNSLEGLMSKFELAEESELGDRSIVIIQSKNGEK